MSRAIAIGIVTYNPSVNLIKRMSCLLESEFHLYIFDNSPEDSAVRKFCTNRRDCNYFTCGKNVGLGLGISFVCAQAYYDSFTALLFFDQDTKFNKDTLDFIDSFHKVNIKIATNYSAVVFNSKNITADVFDTGHHENRFIYKDVKMAINSGSLFYLENLRKINWHNETYFVDGVDYEFCLNSNNNHFKIGECSTAPGFDHESEQDVAKYRIFGKVYIMRAYSKKRVIDAISASVRLLISSIKTTNISYAIEICRLLAGYLFYQLVARLFSKSKIIGTGL